MRRKVLRPIGVVKAEMEEIARGNLSSDFALEADSSEIGMLVDANHRIRSTLQLYIGDISHKLTEIASGNMNLQVDTTYLGDYAPIQRALEVIISSLNRTLRLIHSAAEQVSSGAQALASGSTQQAAAVQALNASEEEIAQRAAANTTNVQAADGYIDEASQGMAAGNRQMHQLTGAMGEISAAWGRLPTSPR